MRHGLLDCRQASACGVKSGYDEVYPACLEKVMLEAVQQPLSQPTAAMLRSHSQETQVISPQRLLVPMQEPFYQQRKPHWGAAAGAHHTSEPGGCTQESRQQRCVQHQVRLPLGVGLPGSIDHRQETRPRDVVYRGHGIARQVVAGIEYGVHHHLLEWATSHSGFMGHPLSSGP
jgi:hypothetical protein